MARGTFREILTPNTRLLRVSSSTAATEESMSETFCFTFVIGESRSGFGERARERGVRHRARPRVHAVVHAAVHADFAPRRRAGSSGLRLPKQH